MKPVQRVALGGFFFYLLLGAFSYTAHVKPTPPGRLGSATLPMSSWTVSEIEARNRRGLQVSARAPRLQGRTAGGAARQLLPDLVPLEPKDLSTVGSRAEGNLRLKFTTTIWNAGNGPLETRGAKNPETGELEVYQFVYLNEPNAPDASAEPRPEAGAASGGSGPGGLDEGSSSEGSSDEVLGKVAGRAERGRRVGRFDYDHRHGHLHFGGFARYELWRVGEGGALLEVVADNAKVGFCLMDIMHIGSGATHLESGLIDEPGGPVYAGCREDIQGISVGWGDEYLSLLYEQDLDLSGVESGSYALVVTANPEGSIEELDYDNNASMIYLRLEDEQLVWTSEENAEAS